MTYLSDEDREALVGWFKGEGLNDKPAEHGDGIHSWRCEYPDVYGPCFCFEQAVADLNAAVESLIVRHRAAELREAAKEIYNGAGDPEQAFYDYGLHPWLTARADLLAPKDGAR